tara:strand:+ start:486 stop:656 length:171 start_codon:yes stop_codon:yes gene_type:complete
MNYITDTNPIQIPKKVKTKTIPKPIKNESIQRSQVEKQPTPKGGGSSKRKPSKPGI